MLRSVIGWKWRIQNNANVMCHCVRVRYLCGARVLHQEPIWSVPSYIGLARRYIANLHNLYVLFFSIRVPCAEVNEEGFIRTGGAMESLGKMEAMRGGNDLLVGVGPIAAGELIDHSSIKVQTNTGDNRNGADYL